jgi:hypothetical protein
MTDQKIYYKKVRDLGGIFGATFGFIKQNFKPLYGSLLFFAGPFLLVASTVSAYMLGSQLNVNRLFGSGLSTLYGDLMGAYAVSMLIMFLGVTVYNVILNRNILENEKLQAGEEMTVKHGIVNFWADFWRILGNTLLLVLVLVVSVVVIVLVFAGIFALAGGDRGSGGAIALAVIGVLLLLVAMLIFGPIFAYVPMAALFVCQRDEVNIFQAIGIVFRYMRDNFWSTWVVSMVGLLTYMVMGMVAQIPVFIITMLTTFTRMKSTVGYGMEDQSTPVLLIVVTAISSLLSYGVMVVYHLISIYQFTHLEEKKEGKSIIDRINQIQ